MAAVIPLIEREQLLGGNWKIPPTARLYFKCEWCAIVEHAPPDLDVVRYWDLAATEKTELNNPDWTVGVKLGRANNGGYWLLDAVRVRAKPVLRRINGRCRIDDRSMAQAILPGLLLPRGLPRASLAPGTGM